MTRDPDHTAQKLAAWHAGEDEAIGDLVEENMGWMRGYVRREIPGQHRRRFDSVDVVQDALVRVLRGKPASAPRNRAEFRALIVRILRGALHDRQDHERAQKRDVNRDQRLPSRGLSRFSPLGEVERSPDSIAGVGEERKRLLAALKSLPAEDREIVRLRYLEGLLFEEIATRLGLHSADAVRMRHNRALPRLARILEAREGD